jgi:hypothetical protein
MFLGLSRLFHQMSLSFVLIEIVQLWLFVAQNKQLVPYLDLNSSDAEFVWKYFQIRFD